MSQDVEGFDGVLDDGDDGHLTTALGTEKRVDLIHLRKQSCPGALSCVNGYFFAVIECLETAAAQLVDC